MHMIAAYQQQYRHPDTVDHHDYAMNSHVVVNVGDPAAASLSSCLRPFPGGFSLLTETGQLRTFFVRSRALPRTDATDASGAKWAGVQLTSADAVELSAPLSQGSFPPDKDVPVDHSWSQDGAVLVVLRRGSFTVYFRGGINECNVFNEDRGTDDSESAPAIRATGKAESTCCAGDTAVDTAQSAVAGRASLGLAKVYSGRNSFEGKVVACCAVPADDSGTHRQFAQNAGDKYLIAIGGTFGIECHRLEECIVQSLAAADDNDNDNNNNNNSNNNNSASHKTRQMRKTSRTGSLASQQTEKLQQDVGNSPHEDAQEDETLENETAAKTTAPAEVPSPPPSTTRHWTCRLLTSLFDGYPVVAVDFSTDANIFAAAAMTGHVKLWEVVCLLAVPLPVQTQATAPASKQPLLVGSGGRGKRGQRRKQGQGSQDQSRAENAAFLRRNELASVVPRSSIGGCVGPKPVWSTALIHSMPRVTSLSFCPDDNATLALACWDGQVVLFQPAILTTSGAVHIQPGKPSLADVPTASKDNRIEDTPGVRSKNGRDRAWKQVCREKSAPSTTAVSHLEDQDGAFVCWCSGHDRTLGTDVTGHLTADLAVSSYRVATGNVVIGNHDAIASSNYLFSSFPASATVTDELGPVFGPIASTGPGFEVFAEGGLGKRSGGVMTGSRSNLPEATAERYLIHGLTAGQNFVALYDSDLCLHVISLGAILEADSVLTTAPSARFSAKNSVAPPSSHFPDVTRDENTLPAGIDPNVVRPETNPTALAESAEPSLKGKHDPPRSAASEVTLVNNDHGLVKAEVCRHGGPGEHCASPEEGLRLSITWRDAFTGTETPDGMEGVMEGVGAGHDDGGRDRWRRLSFLPCYVEGDGNESCNDGVIAADVRWGRVALFTRYIVLVYTRPVLEKNEDTGGGTKGEGLAGGKGWKAYPDGPLVHGVLFGGASTAATHLTERLSRPAADLKQLYIISILEGGSTSQEICENVTSYSVVIRSLSDRRIFCRCHIPMDGNGDVDGDSLVSSNAGMRRQGMNAYVSPGYGGGNFVVADDGGEAAAAAGEAICARVWRGTFDEGLRRVSIASSSVVTSAPWPAPETLRLQGVAGPNCELLLFKEDVDMVKSAADGSVDCEVDEVRWWMTWPEKERWRYADAPRTLAGEDLTVSDFCIIFQQLMETMLTDYDWKPKPEGAPPPTAQN